MSTLRPGKVSPAVKDLRDAAAREMDAAPKGEHKPDKPDFDHDHSKTPPPLDGDFDNDNWVAQYPGLNSPHIGNGSGGVRGW